MYSTEEEFKYLFLGDFTPSEREIALYDRLVQYYKDTPSRMDNRTAQRDWVRFQDWCKKYEYSREEVNTMKRQIPPHIADN